MTGTKNNLILLEFSILAKKAQFGKEIICNIRICDANEFPVKID